VEHGRIRVVVIRSLVLDEVGEIYHEDRLGEKMYRRQCSIKVVLMMLN